MLGKGRELTPEGAFVDSRTSTGAIADLHIGYEHGAGALMLRSQTYDMLKKAKSLILRHSLRRLVLLGDIKHGFSMKSEQERSELKLFLSSLSSIAEVIITMGNHDSGIKQFASSYAELVDFFDDGKNIYYHGHLSVDAPSSRLRVLGNEHPALKLRDEVGALYSYPAFLLFRKRKVLVLPTFNPWAYGTNVLAIQKGAFLSPDLKALDPEEAEVYVISEGVIFFKTIREIKEYVGKEDSCKRS
ncbi:MAG: metallophosphoesterase [Candidatus Anstonellales archaeon]